MFSEIGVIGIENRDVGEISMIEYDETLGEYLLSNNINGGNITDVCLSVYQLCIHHNNIQNTVLNYQNCFRNDGCIFVLPTSQRDNYCWIYYTPMSNSEARKRAKMKAFL